MFNKSSYWLRSGIYTILEKGLTQAFSFATVFILLRKLSIEEMGIWAQFLAITSLLELARNGLLQNGLIKYLSTSNKASYPRILSSSVVLNLVLTIISVIILALSARFLSELCHAPILEDMFYLYLITTILLIPFYHFQFVEQANLSFKALFYSTLIRQGTFFILIFLIFVILGIRLDLKDITILQMIAVIPASISCYLIAKKHLRFYKGIDIFWIKRLLNYGKYSFGTNISSVLLSGIDHIMVGNLLGNASVGLYNLAIRITNLVEIPTNAIASIVFPQSSIRMETEGRPALKKLYEKSVGLILALMLPVSILVLLLPKVLLIIVAGRKYMDAAPILQVTIFFSLLAPFIRQFGTIIDSMGKPRLNFFFTFGSAMVNVLLNFIFIKYFDTIGAAYGTLTTYLLMFTFTQIILSRMFNVSTISVVLHTINYYHLSFNFVLLFVRKGLKGKLYP